MARRLRIRNWAKFQHYKDRNPPWIKLHSEIFASEDWVMLDDASKLLAIVCMVIAAKHDGYVPDNPDYIKRVSFVSKRPNLIPLIECGFLEIVQADDSTLQAVASESKQLHTNVRPETETYTTETETETEAEKKPVEVRASRAAVKGIRWIPDALVPNEWILEGERTRSEHGLPQIDLLLEAEKFANYWTAKSGAGASKLDWRKTWINWALKAEGTRNGPGPRKPTAHDNHLAGIASLVEDLRNRRSAGQG